MRIRFELSPAPSTDFSGWQADVPQGVAISRMDHALTQQLQDDLVAHGSAPWFDQTWGSIANFLNQGFGFVAVGEEGIMSNCRTHSIINGVADIQVSTRNAARCQGLASLVCEAYIEHCLATGLIPGYSCEEDNLASFGLAQKLGFIPAGTE